MRAGHHPVYGYTGFIKGTLQAQASAEVLRKEIERMDSKPLRTASKFVLREAIWSGWYLLHRQAEDKAAEVLSRGQILLCWDGTTALEEVEVAA